jgi:hypothetical protein
VSVPLTEEIEVTAERSSNLARQEFPSLKKHALSLAEGRGRGDFRLPAEGPHTIPLVPLCQRECKSARALIRFDRIYFGQGELSPSVSSSIENSPARSRLIAPEAGWVPR